MPLFEHFEMFRLGDLYEYQVYLFMQNTVNKKLPHSFDGMCHLNYDIQIDHIIRKYTLKMVHHSISKLSSTHCLIFHI